MTSGSAAARERFAELAARTDPELDGDLEQGAILIAAEEYPDLDPAAVRDRLDELGDAARTRLAAATDAADRVERLNRYLFDEAGFAGAREYYDPRNSYLNDVLERRRGIPITLALVYMAAGRRAGLDVRGIPFPGHFLVRCAGPEERIVDAFHGRTLAPAEYAARIEAALGPAPRRGFRMRDASAREILVRILSNLQHIFAERGDSDRLLACCDRILLLTPDDPHALRARALVYQRLGWFAAAIGDLDAALEHSPHAPGDARLRALRDARRARLGPVN